MSDCQLCEKKIEPFTSESNPTIAKVGMVCVGCGILMCLDCCAKRHNCSEQLIKFGWIEKEKIHSR